MISIKPYLNNRINNIIVIISSNWYSSMKNINKGLYKNLACGSVGLLIVFVTSIFVVKDFYGQKITELVDEHTLLKE